MRMHADTKMYKLYENTKRKEQMVDFLIETAQRAPWLFFEQGPALEGEGPTAELENPQPQEPDLAELEQALIPLSAEELLDLIRKVVTAQQEAAAEAEQEEPVTAGPESPVQAPVAAQPPLPGPAGV